MSEDTMSEKLLPFDLETALKEPGRVRDRLGETALQVAHFPDAPEGFRVVVLFSKHAPIFEFYTEHGLHRNGRSVFDRRSELFLAPRTVRRRLWARGYESATNMLHVDHRATYGDQEPNWPYPDSVYLGPAQCIDDREVES